MKINEDRFRSNKSEICCFEQKENDIYIYIYIYTETIVIRSSFESDTPNRSCSENQLGKFDQQASACLSASLRTKNSRNGKLKKKKIKYRRFLFNSLTVMNERLLTSCHVNISVIIPNLGKDSPFLGKSLSKTDGCKRYDKQCEVELILCNQIRKILIFFNLTTTIPRVRTVHKIRGISPQNSPRGEYEMTTIFASLWDLAWHQTAWNRKAEKNHITCCFDVI